MAQPVRTSPDNRTARRHRKAHRAEQTGVIVSDPKATPLVLKASQLRDLVSAVIPLAGGDLTLPVLNAVLVETQGPFVLATATDRFRVGIHRLELESAPADFSAVIRLHSLKRLLATFKPTRYDDPLLSLEVSEPNGAGSGSLLTVTQEGSLDGFVGTTVSVDLETADYPKIRKVITDQLAADSSAGPVSFNASHLGDFKHAVKHGEAVTLRKGASESKAVLVTVGEHFVGAIMPRRLVSSEPGESQVEIYAGWSGFLKPQPVESEAMAS